MVYIVVYVLLCITLGYIYFIYILYFHLSKYYIMFYICFSLRLVSFMLFSVSLIYYWLGDYCSMTAILVMCL